MYCSTLRDIGFCANNFVLFFVRLVYIHSLSGTHYLALQMCFEIRSQAKMYILLYREMVYFCI